MFHWKEPVFWLEKASVSYWNAPVFGWHALMFDGNAPVFGAKSSHRRRTHDEQLPQSLNSVQHWKFRSHAPGV